MISICIPCFNEKQTIEKTYSAIKRELGKTSHEIIFYDDGSTDDTLKKLRAIERTDRSVVVIGGQKNKGVGEAYKRMFSKAKGDYVLITDADLSVPPDYITRFYEEITKTEKDVIVGSRFAEIKTDYPLHRKVLSRLFYLTYLLLLGLKVKDTQSGFAVFKRKAVKSLKLEQKGFESLVEIYWQLSQKGFLIEEKPTDFLHRKSSRVRIIKDSISMTAGIIGLFTQRVFKRKRKI